MEHLEIVKSKHEIYKAMVRASKEEVSQASIKQLGHQHPITKTHYSFDYSQQVLTSSSPMQPGPVSFPVLWKFGLLMCAVNAVHSRQIN